MRNDIPVRRLFLDIETSPNLGVFWSAGWKERIGYENIIVERKVICICYNWQDEGDVTHKLTWDKNQCDKKMLLKIVKVMNEADEIVAHNGKKYDVPFIRTRCLIHDIPMKPKYRVVDTLVIARSILRLNSNRLDYIAGLLGIGQKIKTEFSLWKEVFLNKSKKALNEMVVYCEGDVLLLRDVYMRLKNHIPVQQNYSALYQDDRGNCPECGSDNLKKNGTYATVLGTIKQELLCNDCGKYHTKTRK